MHHERPDDMPQNHDIIVIGGSAGGLEAGKSLLRRLPPDIDAAIFLVIHGTTPLLKKLLAGALRLPVVQAEPGMAFESGKLYLAVPDAHLLLHDGHVLVRRGPRENRARPAVDPLFRSAAASCGTRVIGVVLSGKLDDGAAGLRAIKRCGGVAVVQDPDEALVPDMPLNALRYAEVDDVGKVADLAPLLLRLSKMPAGQAPDIPLDIRLKAAIAAQEAGGMEVENQLGERSPFSCPECHGVLWEIHDGDLLRYRCHIGHAAFSADAMLEGQSAEIDELVSNLLRSHQERAALARRLADNYSGNSQATRDHFRQRADEYERDAQLLHKLFVTGGSQTPVNEEETEGAGRLDAEAKCRG